MLNVPHDWYSRTLMRRVILQENSEDSLRWDILEVKTSQNNQDIKNQLYAAGDLGHVISSDKEVDGVWPISLIIPYAESVTHYIVGIAKNKEEIKSKAYNAARDYAIDVTRQLSEREGYRYEFVDLTISQKVS